MRKKRIPSPNPERIREAAAMMERYYGCVRRRGVSGPKALIPRLMEKFNCSRSVVARALRQTETAMSRPSNNKRSVTGSSRDDLGRAFALSQGSPMVAGDAGMTPVAALSEALGCFLKSGDANGVPKILAEELFKELNKQREDGWIR
jgi:hypothetical protein